MKTVIKYTTFEDLKSSERTSMNIDLSLKKHSDLKKLIKEIRSAKIHKGDKGLTRD